MTSHRNRIVILRSERLSLLTAVLLIDIFAGLRFRVHSSLVGDRSKSSKRCVSIKQRNSDKNKDACSPSAVVGEQRKHFAELLLSTEVSALITGNIGEAAITKWEHVPLVAPLIPHSSVSLSEARSFRRPSRFSSPRGLASTYVVDFLRAAHMPHLAGWRGYSILTI